MCGSDIFLGILAVFFPPVAVWIKVGVCTADSIINLALCCLGYIPGLLHAWYIILQYPEPDYDEINYEPVPAGAAQGRDVENGRVTYYYVAHGPLQQPQRGYGTVGAEQANQQSQQSQQGDGQGGSSRAPAPPTYAEAIKGDNKVQTNE